jgi:DNA-binding NtrC family response regulator
MPAETVQTARRLEVPSEEIIFGSSAGMRAIRGKIERALGDDLPVLIEGESGTGKRLIGQFLHRHSAHREGPFLNLNCAAVPTGLLEGEMFGYDKGAAAGVRETKSGSIGVASGGTLFLDEMGSMDLTLQQKLVRTLKSGHYRRIDGREDLVVNTRFVCATCIDLEAASRNHNFLEELLGCFVHHRVRLLPLRERKEDIPQLCEYLLEKFARDFGRAAPHLSSYVLEAFQRWKWPGNIRELENWIARIVIFGAEEVVGLEFSRQLAAWDQFGLRDLHGSHMRTGRARGLRRHS